MDLIIKEEEGYGYGVFSATFNNISSKKEWMIGNSKINNRIRSIRSV
jgi:hypothetical protein